MEFSSENTRRTALNHAVTLAANGKITDAFGEKLAVSVTAAAAEFERYLKHGGAVTD